MTVAEIIAGRQGREALVWRIMAILLAMLCVSVVALAIFLARNILATNDVTNRVDSALTIATVSICKSRESTLRTAPMTVRDYRAIRDAEGAQARLVCPHLNYGLLALQRRAEIAKLKSGVDPQTVALSVPSQRPSGRITTPDGPDPRFLCPCAKSRIRERPRCH